MSTPAIDPSYYADFNGLESLKAAAKGGTDPKAVRAAARQFESLFTEMLLQSMRAAKLGDGLGDSQATNLYTDMYDQQIALAVSQGKGLGLADMLVQQLTRSGLARGGARPAVGDAAGASGTAGATVATGASGTGTAESSSTTGASHAQRIRFIRQLEPYAQRAASALGVSCDAVIGQAALETGWGMHVPADTRGNSSCNLFGIKSAASWPGSAVAAQTTEFVGGSAQTQTQNFRAYASIGESVRDYVAVLRGNARYAPALGTGENTAAFAAALQQGGYATDPAYAQKLQTAAEAVRALRGTAYVTSAEAGAAAGPGAPVAPGRSGETRLKVSQSLPTYGGGESS